MVEQSKNQPASGNRIPLLQSVLKKVLKAFLKSVCLSDVRAPPNAHIKQKRNKRSIVCWDFSPFANSVIYKIIK